MSTYCTIFAMNQVNKGRTKSLVVILICTGVNHIWPIWYEERGVKKGVAWHFNGYHKKKVKIIVGNMQTLHLSEVMPISNAVFNLKLDLLLFVSSLDHIIINTSYLEGKNEIMKLMMSWQKDLSNWCYIIT